MKIPLLVGQLVKSVIDIKDGRTIRIKESTDEESKNQKN